VVELQERMSSDEFTTWGAFFHLEPFGFDVENWRMGMVASTVANAAGPKRSGKAWRVDDFVPVRKAEPDRGQSMEEQRRILAAMVGGVNHG
jgi:hypothetical protein